MLPQFDYHNFDVLREFSRFSGGWNNNPSCRQFIYTYRRLISRAGVLPSQTANIIPQEGSDLLSSQDEDHFEYDHTLQYLVFSQYTSNGLTYICGWVVRKVFSALKCSACRRALVKVPESITNDFILLRLRDNGGLLYPNEDVRTIVFTAERVLKQENLLTNVNKTKITLHVLRHLQIHDLFKSESEHFDETSTIWCNHLLALTKLIISTFIDLRLHHATKQWNLSGADNNIQQILTRTVIFRH